MATNPHVQRGGRPPEDYGEGDELPPAAAPQRGSAVDRLPPASGRAPAPHRVRMTFKVPDKYRDKAILPDGSERDPKTITIQELTADEELEAYEGGGGSRAVSERLVLKSLAAVDGTPIQHGEFEDRALWARWSPKMRKRAMLAFNSLHNTEDDDDTLFLASAVLEG